MNLTPLFLRFLPVLIVLAVGLLGSTRRLGFWLTLVLSLLLTPIGGLLATLLSGPKRIKRRVVLPDPNRPQRV